MTNKISQMRREIDEIPDAVDRLLTHGKHDISNTADAIRGVNPALIISIARGSSDHVATYLKYAAEINLGLPIASVGPSVASIYKAPMRLENSVSIAVSQSGKSPDIVEMAKSAKRDGALSVALTNDVSSPLGGICDHTLDIHAGPERSVAATKTFVTSAVAGLWLLAEWGQDKALKSAIHALPRALDQAAKINWPEIRETLAQDRSLFTLGRGPSWAVSNEAALKFKETCQIHAESYSSAEVLHGPVSIVDEGFPVLGFAAGDAAEKPLVDIADAIAAKGAKVFATSNMCRAATKLQHIRTAHPLTDPLSLIVSFYAMVEKVALSLGADPDAPRHLKKVTETV